MRKQGLLVVLATVLAGLAGGQMAARALALGGSADQAVEHGRARRDPPHRGKRIGKRHPRPPAQDSE